MSKKKTNTGKNGKPEKKHGDIIYETVGWMFDINGNKKLDFFEQMEAHRFFSNLIEQEKQHSGSSYSGDDSPFSWSGTSSHAHTSWRKFCEDGSKFGIDPMDYATEEEYNDALEWEKFCRKADIEAEYMQKLMNGEEAIDPNYMPDEEEDEFDEFGELSEYIEDNPGEYTKEAARSQFIAEKSETVVAAKYLSPGGDFLYAQAVKDNFELPVTLPDESEKQELDFCGILIKIARKDIPLCFKVWDWCMDQFLCHAEYDICSRSDMTEYVMCRLYDFPDDFEFALVKHIDENREFAKKLLNGAEKMLCCLPGLIIDALKLNLKDTANFLFDEALSKAQGNWREINGLMDDMIRLSKNYEELETIEYVSQHFMPRIKEYPDGMIADEVEFWEKDIAEYMFYVEKNCKQYAYTRSNAWRAEVRKESKHGLKPMHFDSEEEYRAALQKKRYAWRGRYKNSDTCGLNPEAYETHGDFRKALYLKIEEKRKKALEEVTPIGNDNATYTYCGVLLPFSSRPYSYRTENAELKIGDSVVVPVGDKEMTGTIVSIGQYSRAAVPYPLERTRFILRKQDDALKESAE